MTTLLTKVVVLMGDSLTLSGTGTELHSWGSRINVDPTCLPQVQTSNFGKSGDTAAGMALRYLTAVKDLIGDGLYLQGFINSVTANVSAASIIASATAIVDDWVATGKPLWLASTTPFGASSDWTAPRQVVLETVNAWMAAYAAANSGQVIFIDKYEIFGTVGDPTVMDVRWDFGDGKHNNTAGAIKHAVVTAPYFAAAFPPDEEPVALGVSTFGVTPETVRAHHFSQWNGFTANSNPSEDTVEEKILECSGELEAKLLQESITASAITDSSSASYLWCQKTLKLMAAIEILTIATQQAPPLSAKWQEWLDARWKELADNGHLAMGGGTSVPAIQPDGPSHHIVQLGIDMGDVRGNASTGIPPFRRDDEQ